jgi:hypothetical protein
MVRALQAQKIVSTPKHYAVYSVPVGGGDTAKRDPHVASREMEEKNLEPFRMAFQEAGVWEEGGWKEGRMEGWKDGRMEGRKDGRREGERKGGEYNIYIYIYIYISLISVFFFSRSPGALGTMCSYNDYNGEPIAASHKFLTEYLRDKWGFKGMSMWRFADDIIHHFYYLSFLPLPTFISFSLLHQGMW